MDFFLIQITAFRFHQPKVRLALTLTLQMVVIGGKAVLQLCFTMVLKLEHYHMGSQIANSVYLLTKLMLQTTNLKLLPAEVTE